jgi:diguanylate cyclase (GGDEF)-like protein
VVRDVEAQVVGHLWLYEDVTHARRTPEQLLHLAESDALTGLCNRYRFTSELELSLLEAKRNGTKVALVSFGIDDLSYVNDTYGHAAGDRVLTGVADIVDKKTRSNELFCRLRGDEFAVLIRNASETDAKGLAQRITNDLAGLEFEFGGEKFKVTASMGLALYPDHGKSEKELINHADAEISLSRRSGNNS